MRFWYLLGVLSKIFDEHPRHFHTVVPPLGCIHCVHGNVQSLVNQAFNGTMENWVLEEVLKTGIQALLEKT